MRRFFLLVSALLVLLALPCSAHTLQTYEDLALRVNLDDQLRVVDRTGRTATGRLTQLTRDAIVLNTTSGAARFAIDAIHSVDVVGHAMRRGALIGAAAFLGLNAIAAAKNKDAGGAAGAIGSAVAGAGVGTGIGALIPQIAARYDAPGRGLTSGTTAGGFFDRIALRVNLDDELQVETGDGTRVTGRLSGLTDHDLTLTTDSGHKTMASDAIRQIARPHRPIRAAALIGAAAGAVTGAVAGCTGSDRSECFDGALLVGGLGAGAGAIVGALIPLRTTIYPEPAAVVTTIAPVWHRRGVGVNVQVRW